MKIQAYSADFLYLGNDQLLPKGIIEFNEDGFITSIGTNVSSPEIIVKKLEGALCPGFINAHCHLELSHLKGKVSQGRKLTGFIQELQSIRNSEQGEILGAAKVADWAMQEAGIVAVADICNDELCFQLKSESKMHYHNFIELFGFSPEKAEKVFNHGLAVLEKAKGLNMSASLVPHSPYSVSEELMEKIAQNNPNSLISIHNQESASENEFFQNACGDMAEFLSGFGNSLSHFKALKKSSIHSYLHRFFEAKSMLLVHNTFSSKEDIEFAKESHDKLFWCFCPSANWYIERRFPQFQNFIQAGVKCCLGTDSLASNHTLSLVEEMKLIQQHDSSIQTSRLMEWACLNGAKFLGLDDQLGSLELGKKPGLNWIKNIESAHTLGKDSMVEVLV